MKKDRRITIAVLMGGVSSESEVSLHSGQGVADALRKAGFDVIEAVLPSADLSVIEGRAVDVAFIALHGQFGEDGRIQHLLEEAGIPYTGSGPEASAAAMDKVVSKRQFIEAGVPTLDYVVLEDAPAAGEAARVFDRLGPRVVVKPAAQGSSIGVSIVERDGFDDAVREALRYDGRVVIEPFVRGRELTLGIVGGSALPIIELKPHRQFFDYTAKYQYGETTYVIGPELPGRVAEAATAAGLGAFNCLGCRDLARTDMMLAENGEVFVLEVNTIPGFTETSLGPMAAKAVGVEFPALCRQLVEMALERFTAARPG